MKKVKMMANCASLSLCHVGVLLLFLIGCKTNKNSENASFNNIYDISIVYLSLLDTIKTDRYNQGVPLDSIYLFVESHFKQDTLTVYLNNKLSFEQIMTTDGRLGLADYFALGLDSEIGSIAVRLNHGNLAYLEISEQHHFIRIQYRDKCLKLIAQKVAPFYE